MVVGLGSGFNNFSFVYKEKVISLPRSYYNNKPPSLGAFCVLSENIVRLSNNPIIVVLYINNSLDLQYQKRYNTNKKNIMNTSITTQITELQIAVQEANTLQVAGRGTVARACRELYNLLEEQVYETLGEQAVNAMYVALCEGNFSTPVTCDAKIELFNKYAAIA